jgi:hypothetical protein
MENTGRYKKGNIPWTKGRKGIHLSPETEFKKGKHYSLATEFKKGEQCGENNINWKGGRHKLVTGYIMINCPNHPRAYRNEVYEHIVVAEKKLGRFLMKGERVHHINGIKGDNSPENIIVCKSHKEHMSKHHLTTWSRGYSQCVKCGTSERRYEGRGLCGRCYKKERYANKKK